MDICEALIPAAVAKGEPFVVEAQLVQERRVDVVDIERVDDRGVAKFVRLAKRHSGFESASGKKDRISVYMMIPSGVGVDRRSVGGAPHFARNHQQDLVR